MARNIDFAVPVVDGHLKIILNNLLKMIKNVEIQIREHEKEQKD